MATVAERWDGCASGYTHTKDLEGRDVRLKPNSIWRARALAIALMVMALASCDRIGGERPLVVVFDDLPVSLDPHLQNHSVTWSLLGNFYDSLVRFSPVMKLEPALAVSWKQVTPTRWRLVLRQGVFFHDGQPFGARDVVASFHRAQTHPRSKVRHHLHGVTSVTADGDGAVIVETAQPSPDLLNRLTFLFVVPQSLVAAAEMAAPVGTGPYRFIARHPDGTVEAVGFDGWRGMPAIRRVNFVFYIDEDQAAQSFFDGRADVCHLLPDDQVGSAEQRPDLRVEPQPRLAVQLLVVNPSAAEGPARRALADPRVRRALLLALDRGGWVGRVYRGNATVATQYVHPVVFGYDPEIAAVGYDPRQARALLAQAGFADGFEVTLGHGSLRSGVVEAIVADLERVGVRVRPVEANFGAVLDQGVQGKLPLLLYAWACSTGDASDFLNSSIHTRDAATGLGMENFAGFSNPALDALLDAADRELNPLRRRELLQSAQRQVLAELPVLPLTIRWGFHGLSSRVEILTRHDERVWVAGFRWRR